MKVHVQDGGVEARLTGAILLYSAAQRYSSANGVTFASMHEVANVGTDKKPNLQVMPGSPITKDGLIQALGKLAEEYLFDIELFPETLLSNSPKHLLWWKPAGNARVFFRCKELGQISAVVPHPALVFCIMNGRWSVHALAESKRPTLHSPLHRAPYFNVWDDGNICVGSAAVPDRPTPSSIPAWEKAFFESEFTHTNGHIRKVAHPRGEYAFWREMLDGVYTEFPVEMLVPANLALASLLKPVSGMGHGHG